MKNWAAIALFTLLLTACRKDAPPVLPPTPKPLLFVPPGFPEPVFPVGNELTSARFALGKRLFYDPIMSLDSTVSCASCHHLAKAFSDSVRFSPGVAGAPGTRNSPSLANVGYQPYFTREGGVATLEMQVLVPIQEHNELNFNIVLIAERLKKDSSFVRQCLESYGRQPDPFCITRAIACFERTFVSGQSRFDGFYYSGKKSALSAPELRGKDLFFGQKTNCSACHGGFNFTNYAFENNGLYENYPDAGRFRLTEDSTDLARFKVPTLRNVGLTAPFMHDGSLTTIEAVVAHYNSGGKAHPHRSVLVKPLGLSAAEKSDLVAFLKSLTDEEFVSNPKFR